MPTIVQHYDKKTGKTRVYESTPRYDPVTEQSAKKYSKSTVNSNGIIIKKESKSLIFTGLKIPRAYSA